MSNSSELDDVKAAKGFFDSLPWYLKIVPWLLILGVIFLVSPKPWGYVENYQLGYRFNSQNGSITVLDRPGYHFRNIIFDRINTVDLRPMQTCINANQRVLNCKLVQFNPDRENNYAGFRTFLSWHGRADYEGSGLEEILKSYAYDGNARTYPFLTVLRELRSDENPPRPAVVAPAAPPASSAVAQP
jgi:hypothetical protein